MKYNRALVLFTSRHSAFSSASINNLSTVGSSMMSIDLDQPLVGIVRVCKFLRQFLLTFDFSLQMSAVHGSENQQLMVLDDRLVDMREALLTNDPKLGSLHQSRPDPATLNAQFKWMSLNVANCVSNKWHNLKSLTVETQNLGPKIYARSPE